jgi:ecdysteroid kinase
LKATDPPGTDRPYSTRQGSLPRDLEDVTPQWLTALLANKYPGIAVNNFEVVDVINSHTTKLRLKLDLNDVGKAAGIPEHVCLKSNWSLGFESGEICELEARFYYLMRDSLKAPVPDTYYADWDGDGSGRGIVVMEDLGVTPGEFGNSTHHLGVDGVADALDSLAVLHAALWGSSVLDEQTWLHRSMDTPIDCDQVLRNWNYAAHNLAKESYRQILPAWLYETPELFCQAFDELAHMERELAGAICLVHGDSHQGNSFLRADGERVWMDWQLVRKGHPWRDINYFMLGALTIEERRSSAENLLRHYRESLVKYGASDVPGQETAWQQFIRWPVYGMQAWLANMDKWGQAGLEMVNRFFTAAADYDTINLLTAGKKPRRRIKLGEGARPIAPDLV